MALPKIAVWGASGVGKSTFVAGSLLTMHKFSLGWKWILNGEGEEYEKTHEFIQYEMNTLLSGNMLPPTSADKKPDRYIFQFEQEGNFWGIRGRYHKVELIDVAGIRTEDTDEDEAEFRYFETLCQSQGILMMVDPNLKEEDGPATAQRARKTYFQLINRLIKYLKTTRLGGTMLNIPLAICLTKMEQEEHWKYRNRPADYLQTLLGPIIFNQINDTFKTKEYFAVSTVGRYQNPIKGEIPNIDAKEEIFLNVDEWQPYRLLDQLFWLLDQLAGSRDARLSWWQRKLRKLVREDNYKK